MIDRRWRMMHQCLQRQVGLISTVSVSDEFCNYMLVSTASVCVHHTARLHISALFILQKLEQLVVELSGAECLKLNCWSDSVLELRRRAMRSSNMDTWWCGMGPKAAMCISNLFHRSPHWISVDRHRQRAGPWLQDLMSKTAAQVWNTRSMPLPFAVLVCSWAYNFDTVWQDLSNIISLLFISILCRVMPHG